MDYLDPTKHRQHTIRLMIGYVLIGIAIVFATIILLEMAYGFGVGKDGQVIQNGLVFVSSQPNPADIYLNDKLYRSQTNTRMQLPAGSYVVKLQRAGYLPWQRAISVEGGQVTHYDYPFLVPSKLITSNIKSYPTPPGLATQSPDRHWVLAQQPGSLLDFDLYDLSNPKKVTSSLTSIKIPGNILTSPKSTDSWQFVEWSTDNRHLLLQHIYNGGSEYVMIDHQAPETSVNLTKTLKLGATEQISLRNKKFDQYFVYDTDAHTLATTGVTDPTMTPMLEHVLAYKTYGTDMVLYVTDQNAPKDKVNLVLKDGGNSYNLRDYPAGPPYLVELAQYSGDWYAVAGSGAEGKIYVYKNPQSDRQQSTTKALVPVQVLKVPNANYVAFSTNTRFVMVENANQFAVYDAEYDKGYTFHAKAALDAPQQHASWMDGHRIRYVSGGKLEILDYDNINEHTLVPANANYLTYFDRDYKYLYTLASGSDNQTAMTDTSMLIPADQ